MSLSARADGGEAVFTVVDDGLGVPAEEQKKIFVLRKKKPLAPRLSRERALGLRSAGR